jgi:hypothetical protein
MRSDAAEAAGRLIAAATEALGRAKQAGVADARGTERVTATSGYRSSEHQARLWRSYFPKYYRRTESQRASLSGGSHGPAAVAYMIDVFRVPRWIAAPGYSNHQSGIAIDLKQDRAAGSAIRNSSNAAQLAAWRRSWLHSWLTQNAASFGFQPYAREPWHWVFRSAGVSRLYEQSEATEAGTAEARDEFEQFGAAWAPEAAEDQGEWLDEAETGVATEDEELFAEFGEAGTPNPENEAVSTAAGEAWASGEPEVQSFDALGGAGVEATGEWLLESGEEEGLEAEEPESEDEAAGSTAAESVGDEMFEAETEGAFENDGSLEDEGSFEVQGEDIFEARYQSEGPAGMATLDETPGSPANDPPPVVAHPDWPGRLLRLTKQPYMQGPDVKAWQRRLIEREWKAVFGQPFVDDGVYSPRTAVVTTRFQQLQGLPSTGIVDAVTWAAAWITGPSVAAKVKAAKVFYDRGAAFDYARRHWNVVCSDNVVAGKFGKVAFKAVPAGTKFVNDGGSEHAEQPDASQIPWKNLDDCTHFISCCIGQPPGGGAGGLKIAGQLGAPPKAPYGIVRVSSLVDFLKNKKWVAVEGERSKNQKLIAKLARGDLVAYYNEAKGRYTHMAFYLGNGKIACHTYCRFDKTIEPANTWDDMWPLGADKGFSWTFLRFVV